MDENIIPVLNHGYVRLVDSMGNDLSIVRAARVSYDADWRVGEDAGKDEKLIKYLLTNRHTSPFESVTFTFEVQAPLFVLRHWQRHRTWSFNEVSARYTEMPELFYIPDLEDITTQHTSNKQMRSDEVNQHNQEIREIMHTSMYEAFYKYKLLLSKHCPRELARTVLPQSMYSRMFATVNLHNLLHFLRLRDHPHTQKETQVYAKAIKQLITKVVPITMSLSN